ncbi:MAG TPA: hypothetical protein DCZ94_22870 [Lentisphaeria bacterium]|nr:MAG: hypothetical protein A2X48_02425 [Lentisphaerae bacterium GWF2_49_21]HBC89792.1 hypothetical protein [Lentisphaeria bacterium]
MSRNIAKELARSVAEKRKMEQKRIAERKRYEHGALANQAVGNRKSLEEEIRRKSAAEKFLPHAKVILILFLFVAFIVVSAGVLDKYMRNSKARYSNTNGVIFDPYKADSETRARIKEMENKIPEIIEKGKSPEISNLKAQVGQSFKFDIVSLAKVQNETAATVEIIGDGTAPVPVVFRWSQDGKFINLKY